MPRTSAPTIAYDILQAKCKELGIKSWPEYQKRYKEIEGAKKTLHACYGKQWTGNIAFFGEEARVPRKVKTNVEPKAPKANLANKSASPAKSKAPAKKAAAKPSNKKIAKPVAVATETTAVVS